MHIGRRTEERGRGQRVRTRRRRREEREVLRDADVCAVCDAVHAGFVGQVALGEEHEGRGERLRQALEELGSVHVVELLV